MTGSNTDFEILKPYGAHTVGIVFDKEHKVKNIMNTYTIMNKLNIKKHVKDNQKYKNMSISYSSGTKCFYLSAVCFIQNWKYIIIIIIF